MNVTFEAQRHQDGTWRVVMSRPGYPQTQIETCASEDEATDWIETKAGEWLKRMGGDI